MRVIVVTGASGLLGRAVVEAAVSEDYFVLCLDCSPMHDEVHSSRNVKSVVVDVSDRQALKNAVQLFLAENHNQVVGLVNCAAENPTPNLGESEGDLFALDAFSWNAQISGVLTPTAVAVAVVSEMMVANGQGSIVNVASDLGIIAPDQRVYEAIEGTGRYRKPAAYTTAKHAVIGFTKHVATLLAEYGVRCNAVAPGPIVQEMSMGMKLELESRIPLGRLAEVEEVAHAIMFLVSDKSAFITGTTVVVDGGRTIW